MKKNKLLIAAVIATLLCLSSCKKEENGKVLFKATIESTARQSKTDIANDGTMTWHSGDRIVVFYGTSATNMTGQSLLSTTSTGRTAEFTLALGDEPTGGHYYAVYPANIAGMIYHNRINLPETQEYHAAEGDKVQFEAPMYAYSNDDQLAFKNLCGVVRITLTAPKTISRIVISANEPLCGQFTVNWNGGEPTLAAISTEGTEVEFTCGSGVDCTNGADFYLYLPVNETGYTGMEFAFYATDGSRCSKTLKSDQRYVVGRNTLNPLVFGNMTFRPVGSKGGLFSVSATQQVYFSQGNLQYQASSNTWRFAKHQYDYVGYNGNYNDYDHAEGYNSSTYSGWIDLFGWGTGNNPTLTTDRIYEGWDTNGNRFYCYGTFVDWGSNAISNGGNTANQWRSLTSDEWDYLLNFRTNASAKRGTGNINQVGGLIILPDSWALPSGCSFTAGFSTYDENSFPDWTLNSYTLAQWAQMEAAGAVFLPAAGYRYVTSLDFVDVEGHYWSSTGVGEHEEDSYDDHATARSMMFSSDLFTTDWRNRYLGFSVRPVQDIN